MFDTNPSLIQDASQALPPLVLIHDGGGTTFSYHLLSSLGRRVYGIANPRFHTHKPWVGGIHEMAEHYAELMATKVVSGPVILGGWSLGGVLALEITSVLATTAPAIRVIGIVMVDSVWPAPPPGGWGPEQQRVVQRRIEWARSTRPETKEAVEWCFQESHRMLRDWQPPPFPQPSPSAVLLRAKSAVPTPEDGLISFDRYRHDRHLGWDSYQPDLFCRVIDTPGHHYNVFDLKHLDDVSDAIKVACEVIDQKHGEASR